jgi:hypothetical protein
MGGAGLGFGVLGPLLMSVDGMPVPLGTYPLEKRQHRAPRLGMPDGLTRESLLIEIQRCW